MRAIVWHGKERLDEMTGGDGPDRCIDAVGCEAHAHGSIDAVLDKVKAEIKLGTDRAHVLREAIINCRKGGTVSVPGVYVVPIGAAMNKGLTLRMGQCPVHKYKKQLLQRIEKGEIDPSFVISHTVPLEKGPEMHKTFRDKKDNCIKVVLKPAAS